MNEEGPKKAKVIDLTERQRWESNKSKRKGLGATPDGLALYSEENIKITTREALELARGIVKNHGLDSEEERYRAREINFGLNRRSLSLHRAHVRQPSTSTDELLRLLSPYRDSSPRRVTELVFAAAEELIRRLEPKKQG